MDYDSIIIGGGVSGLSAAYYLVREGRRVLVIERGHQFFERRRNNSFDVANGVGGSGLFSDGKLSLYPSATQLWRLDKGNLKKSYEEIKHFMSSFGIEIPSFEEEWTKEIIEEISPFEKNYNSLYLSQEQRIMMTFKLIQQLGSEIILANTEVLQINAKNNVFEILTKKENERRTFRTHTVVLAGGKHQFDSLANSFIGLQVERFGKYEIGVRVECPNDCFDYFDNKQPDVKLIEKNGEYEIRTFCCCRGGHVLESVSDGFVSHNGTSSDFEKTGNTNIGIIVTVPSKAISATQIHRLRNLKGRSIQLTDFMRGESVAIVEKIDTIIRDFIRYRFPRMALCLKGKVFFPETERFGQYPVLGDKLRLGNMGVWVAGDATGIFRGLLPAFVSGVYVARMITNHLKEIELSLMRKFHIKNSSNARRKVVFTAQSKQWFFCRNAICEFVFKNECIPVNPFRMFGYFLDDRVDRGLVRNGNNEMILRCDELWVFGPISDGVLYEIFNCIRQGKPVRFFSIGTTANEIKEIPIDEATFEPEVHAHQIKKDDLKQLIDYGGGIECVNQLNLFDEV